jgi:spermidine/putrescine transport system permease protein
MIIGHITFQIAFVALVVRSGLMTIGRDIDEAARDHFASTPYLLRRVTIPLLLPGIIAGAMLAFTLSLEISSLASLRPDPDSVTLPIYIYPPCDGE